MVVIILKLPYVRSALEISSMAVDSWSFHCMWWKLNLGQKSNLFLILNLINYANGALQNKLFNDRPLISKF